ncbi:hypothetical protein IFM89_014743 [Coptis chinensis]|uniref:Uncharacterized protein n=1 Tax=Coptis chinensis TaxID=261450 RepID=A0A835IMR3_9MAGN|nr:hypothetical protein IFM89_014743 [Coptis chinensis]
MEAHPDYYEPILRAEKVAEQEAIKELEAILINCSRGPVVDEVALVEHLKENPMFRVGLDVFEDEPYMKPAGLADMKNAVIVPHIASASKWTREGMATLAALNVLGKIKGYPVWSNANNVEPFLNENSPPPAASPSIVNAKTLDQEDVPTHCAIMRGQAQVQRVDQRRANGDNDITLKILYCGICHFDLHSIKNEWGNAAYPIIPGPMKYFGLSKPGMHLGVVGLGGLGHVAVKFGKAFGLKVTVINTSLSKKQEAIEHLGADDFLAAMGTLDGIIDTVFDVHPLMPLISLLKNHEKLVMVGAPEQPLELPVFPLLMRDIFRECLDPFDEPECEAIDLFVNATLCIGKDVLKDYLERLEYTFGVC